MSGLYEEEEIPLPLVRRIRPSAQEDAREEDSSHLERRSATDRMRPGPSGGIAGLLAGTAALGVVHAMTPGALLGPVAAAAAQWGVAPEVSFAVAYGTAGAIGALVGASFASVTRYLRRWVPLVIWSLVFFVSLTLLLLALSRTYGRGVSEALTPAILAASAAYAFVVSFALPLRKRARGAN
jgi:hypothetical protein